MDYSVCNQTLLLSNSVFESYYKSEIDIFAAQYLHVSMIMLLG